MSSTGWLRLRRHLVVAVIVVLGAAFLPLAAASAAPNARATHLSGFSTARANVRVGGVIFDGVTVLPRATRAVTVQVRRAGARAFHAASTGRTTTRGAITLALRAPGAGTWQFRAVVAPTRAAKRFVSATRTLVASGKAARTTIGGFDSSAVTVSSGQTVTDDIAISPRGQRTVLVQARRPGSSAYLTQSQGTSSRSGGYTVSYRPSSVGAWSFRVVVRATAQALPATSPARSVTVNAANPGGNPGGNPADTTAPGPVTGLRVTSVTGSSISLAWTNPSDSDYDGVIVRRALGAVAPASKTAGTAVADLSASSTRLTDDRLGTSTQYSYALFAHDKTGNVAAAATITRRTANATGLVVIARTATVRLQWNNPDDPALARSLIVRKAGNRAPSNVTDGLEVAQLPANRTSYDDAGDGTACLDEGDYSYTVFALDQDGNVLNQSTGSDTIASEPRGAELLVNPIGLPTEKVTVGTPVTFDASCSFAPSALTSGTVDFGDSSAAGTFSDAANGPSQGWNIHHTYAAAGDYTVTLTTTNAGGSDTTTVPIHAYPAPTATLSVSGPAKAGQPVSFTLGSSTPSGTTVTNYDLVFTPDCLNVVGVCASYFHVTEPKAPPTNKPVVINTPGSYTVTLELENDAGAVSAPAQALVVVVP
jgi:hypothetical protein